MIREDIMEQLQNHLEQTKVDLSPEGQADHAETWGEPMDVVQKLRGTAAYLLNAAAFLEGLR